MQEMEEFLPISIKTRIKRNNLQQSLDIGTSFQEPDNLTLERKLKVILYLTLPIIRMNCTAILYHCIASYIVILYPSEA